MAQITRAVPAPSPSRDQRIAFAALIAGALAIAFAPIFVRISEIGPMATAFWRVALATPVLMALARASVARRGVKRVSDVAEAPGTAPAKQSAAIFFIFCGLMFAGDLALWHQSIALTTVANATLLANLAPIFVALAAWALFGQKITRLFIAGLALAISGAIILTGASIHVGTRALIGDALGIGTAMFYAAYQLGVARLRRGHDAVTIMAWSSLVTACALLIITAASGEALLPASLSGWAVLIGIALISHAAGQTLIAYGFAHLPVALSSTSLLLQPVSAAFLAWALLGERLGWLDLLGAAVVLGGIALARRVS